MSYFTYFDYHQNVWLISVPPGHRLVADVSLSHRQHPLRCRVSGQHDVGHEGVITGCDAFSIRSSIADPRPVSIPINYLHSRRFSKSHPQLLV